MAGTISVALYICVTVVFRYLCLLCSCHWVTEIPETAPGLDAVTADEGTVLLYVGYRTSPWSVPRREINTRGPDPCRAWRPRLRYPTPGTSCVYWRRCRVPTPLSDKWLQASWRWYNNAGTGIAYLVHWLGSGLDGPGWQIFLSSETSRMSLKPLSSFLFTESRWFFPGGKPAGTWKWSLSSIYCQG